MQSRYRPSVSAYLPIHVWWCFRSWRGGRIAAEAGGGGEFYHLIISSSHPIGGGEGGKKDRRVINLHVTKDDVAAHVPSGTFFLYLS